LLERTSPHADDPLPSRESNFDGQFRTFAKGGLKSINLSGEHPGARQRCSNQGLLCPDDCVEPLLDKLTLGVATFGAAAGTA
jgi:hypothetical protein